MIFAVCSFHFTPAERYAVSLRQLDAALLAAKMASMAKTFIPSDVRCQSLQ
jgi:hypothetical protein